MTQEESQELWDELQTRVQNHNQQIAEKGTLENHLHLEVIEKLSFGGVLCKGTAGHLSIMFDIGHNVGDIISFLPTGEKNGDAVGVNLVNKTSNN